MYHNIAPFVPGRGRKPVHGDTHSVALPTPDGASALPEPGFVSPIQGWQWDLGHLDGQATATLTATLRLNRLPAGQALLVRPQAIAAGLAAPVLARGGAPVAAVRGAATAEFTPGAPATLRSRDGRLTLRLPANAADRHLTLRHRPLADALPELIARGLPVPARIAGFKHAFSPFALDATDDTGADLHQFSAPLTITVSYTPEQLDALGLAEPT